MFITFEGIDGAGKTTQIERVRDKLMVMGIPVVCTREPGGTAIGDDIRSILLNPDHIGMDATAEVLLYAASRAQLLKEVIRPALARGEVVICDRFVDASLAYQGAGLGVGEAKVAAINAFATDGLTPDLTLLFDFPVSESETRILNSRQGSAPDRIERRGSEYFNRVRDAFLKIARDSSTRVQIIDAMQSRDFVEQEIWVQISNLLRIRGLGGDSYENGIGGCAR